MKKSDIATSRHCEVSTLQSRNLTCELVTLQPPTRPFNLASSVATLQRLELPQIWPILEKCRALALQPTGTLGGISASVWQNVRSKSMEGRSAMAFALWL